MSAAAPLDVLAFGAHADDVELGCGGTLATLAARGRRVGICDLTRGETGTRGTPEVREREAAEAARILGAVVRETLDLTDGGLRLDREAELAVIDVVRRHRPRLVLAPFGSDRHPDHARASRLVTEASWYAGLSSLKRAAPQHRPQQVALYPAAYDFGRPPTFVVDVSDGWETKMAAIRAFRSQFFGGDGRGAQTYVSSKAFLDGIVARAQAYGRIANVAYAEAFVTPLPPRLDDPIAAYEGYEPGMPVGAALPSKSSPSSNPAARPVRKRGR